MMELVQSLEVAWTLVGLWVSPQQQAEQVYSQLADSSQRVVVAWRLRETPALRVGTALELVSPPLEQRA